MMRVIFLAFFIFISFSLPSYAGGDYEYVKVESLKMLNSTDYILVVAPIKSDNPYKTPYLGECTKFEVHGVYGWRYYFPLLKPKPRFVSRENHVQALEKLRQYVGTDKSAEFGYIGSGFNILDEKNQCVVESRALFLDEDGAIYSYYKYP